MTTQVYQQEILFAFIEGVTSNSHGIESRSDIIISTVDRLMSHHGCTSLTDYLGYISRDKAALNQFISETTIHTTSWFREQQHFSFLSEDALGFCRKLETHAGHKRLYKVASFGCSSGEEVYSLGLVLEKIRLANPAFDYQLMGFDIDRHALGKAKQALYPISRLVKIPSEFHSLIWEGSGPTKDLFTLDKAIRERCQFKQLNVTTIEGSLAGQQFNTVLLRNTLIYFSKDNVLKILQGLLPLLKDHGHLLVGHCESILVADDLGLDNVSTSIFIKSKNSHKSKVAKRILVIEDSQTTQLVLKELLENAGFTVDSVSSRKALDSYFIEHEPPDLISLDLHMQDFNGELWLQSYRQRSSDPPIIVVSSLFAQDTTPVINMLASGAEDYIEKSLLFKDPAAVVNRFQALTQKDQVTIDHLSPVKLIDTKVQPEILLIGASTGGIKVIKDLLTGMPQSLPPVVVVQHISAQYAAEFGDHLERVTGLNLGITDNKTRLQQGHIYIATGDYHLTVFKEKNSLFVVPTKYPESQFRPSVDVLFSSVDQSIGKRCVSILLTGMGKDGVTGMKKLHNLGALTIAQDKDSSAVFGMPGEAIKQGVVDYVANPHQIREFLLRVAMNQ